MKKKALKLLGILIIAGAAMANRTAGATGQDLCAQHCIFKCRPGFSCCKVHGCFGCFDPNLCGT